MKMASAQVVKTSIANNSPSQDSNHPDDLFESKYVTLGFKPFFLFTQGIANLQVPESHAAFSHCHTHTHTHTQISFGGRGEGEIDFDQFYIS